MKIFRQMVLFIALCTAFVNILYAQHDREHKRKGPPKREAFYFDALDFYTPVGSKSRVDLYVELPLSNFEFEKSAAGDNNFVSNLNMTVDVYDMSKIVVYDTSGKEQLQTKNTETEYLARRSTILTRNILLPPGIYNIKITIYEVSTKKSYESQREITVRDFSSPFFSVSDVMMVSKVSDVNGRKSLTPCVSRNIGTLDTFSLFFIIYKNDCDKDISITTKITGDDGREVYTRLDSISGASKEMENQFVYSIPTSIMDYGSYGIEITAESPPYKAVGKFRFENLNTDFPFLLNLNDVDKMIDQLQYIAKDSELRYMKAGKTDAEKRKRFIDFWKSKNPNPGSVKNAAMNVYYSRLEYANQHFGTTFTEGWRSDMGMVFIIFGNPSYIERHPFEMDTKPYEVWDYYDINREFVFVDNIGFGDYQLITPIWDTFRYTDQN